MYKKSSIQIAWDNIFIWTYCRDVSNVCKRKERFTVWFLCPVTVRVYFRVWFQCFTELLFRAQQWLMQFHYSASGGSLCYVSERFLSQTLLFGQALTLTWLCHIKTYGLGILMDFCCTRYTMVTSLMIKLMKSMRGRDECTK